MNLVIDTSVVIAVIANEAHKNQLVEISKGADLLAPSALHWEIGNAFSAMFKRSRMTLEQARDALVVYNRIPMRFFDVNLDKALELSDVFSIYAYDAYFILCALENNAPLVSLDAGLLNAAHRAGVKIIEVKT